MFEKKIKASRHHEVTVADRKFDYPPRGTVLDALDCKQQK